MIGHAVGTEHESVRAVRLSRRAPGVFRWWVTRRALIRGALTAPIGAAAIPLLAIGPAAATVKLSQESSSTGNCDCKAVRFALAVLPDTQYLFDADSADPEPLRAMFRYLVAGRKVANIAFMTHLGDVTETGANDERSLTSKTFATIDGKVAQFTSPPPGRAGWISTCSSRSGGPATRSVGSGPGCPPTWTW